MNDDLKKGGAWPTIPIPTSKRPTVPHLQRNTLPMNNKFMGCSKKVFDASMLDNPAPKLARIDSTYVPDEGTAQVVQSYEEEVHVIEVRITGDASLRLKTALIYVLMFVLGVVFDGMAMYAMHRQ